VRFSTLQLGRRQTLFWCRYRPRLVSLSVSLSARPPPLGPWCHSMAECCKCTRQTWRRVQHVFTDSAMGPRSCCVQKPNPSHPCSKQPHICAPQQKRNCLAITIRIVSASLISTTPCYSLPGVWRASRTSQVRRRDACKRLISRMAPCGTMSVALQSCGRGAHGPRLEPHRLGPADGLTRSRGGPPSCACAKTIRLASYSYALVALKVLRSVAGKCPCQLVKHMTAAGRDSCRWAGDAGQPNRETKRQKSPEDRRQRHRRLRRYVLPSALPAVADCAHAVLQQ